MTLTLTPHRDAAAATVEEARRRAAEAPDRHPYQDAAHRMAIETTAAILIGAGELQDLGAPVSLGGQAVIRSIAASLASFLMTVAGGREDLAVQALRLAMPELEACAIERIHAAKHYGIGANVPASQPWGQA